MGVEDFSFTDFVTKAYHCPVVI